MKLELKNVSVYYNKVEAVKDISFSLEDKDFITLIGANGAGKSTILRAISGLVKITSGDIILNGQNINKISADKILKMGLAQVPEGRKIFKTLSVLENLYLGAFIEKDKTKIQEQLEFIFAMFPKLFERQKQLAGTMSGGEQQMLSIGRALMSKPKMLLLDEPSLGLAPIIVQDIIKTLIQINKESHVAIILVEQNADLALKTAQYGYLLENGKITLSDKGSNLINNDYVQKAYLGI